MAGPRRGERATAFGSDLDAGLRALERVHRLGTPPVLRHGQPFTDDEVARRWCNPTQVFGIGLNYQAQRLRGGRQAVLVQPAVFTQIVTSITGPTHCDSSSDSVDWEVELVVVIGERAENVPAERHAVRRGPHAGQDLSERDVQLAARSRNSPSASPTQVSAHRPDDRQSRRVVDLTTWPSRAPSMGGPAGRPHQDLIFRSVPGLVPVVDPALLRATSSSLVLRPASAWAGPEAVSEAAATLVSEIEDWRAPQRSRLPVSEDRS